MILSFADYLNHMSPVARVVISVALMLFIGFAFTRVTKLLRLPNVTAYILAGIIMGPFCFRLIPTSVITGMEFISDIALAFIAFSTGEFFRLDVLKKNGSKTIIITIFESLFAGSRKLKGASLSPQFSPQLSQLWSQFCAIVSSWYGMRAAGPFSSTTVIISYSFRFTIRIYDDKLST